MDPPFEALESQIEGMWRELLQDNLSLFPMPKVGSAASLCTIRTKHLGWGWCPWARAPACLPAVSPKSERQRCDTPPRFMHAKQQACQTNTMLQPPASVHLAANG